MRSLINLFFRSIGNIAADLVHSQLRERFQKQRANLFMALMKPQADISILDVGGGWGDFLSRIKNNVNVKCVIADIEDHTIRVQQKYGKHGFRFVHLVEGMPLPFVDQQFDIVISLSVIEHVTSKEIPEGTSREWASISLQKQRQFANEIRRVGRAYFVHTPHKGFPIETHTWMPFANVLGHASTVALVNFIDKWWIKKCGGADWNLLGIMEMKILFPEAQIHVERLCGLPKGVIAFTPPKSESLLRIGPTRRLPRDPEIVPGNTAR